MIIEETARIVALEGDQAWVVTQRRSACDSCGANKACGTGLMARALPKGPGLKIQAFNTTEAKVGDDVVLGIDDRVLLRSAVLMYLFPLLALMGGAFLGELASNYLLIVDNEYMSLLGGLSAMAGVLFWLRRQTHLLAASGEYQPRILRVCGPVMVVVGS